LRYHHDPEPRDRAADPAGRPDDGGGLRDREGVHGSGVAQHSDLLRADGHRAPARHLHTGADAVAAVRGIGEIARRRCQALWVRHHCTTLSGTLRHGVRPGGADTRALARIPDDRRCRSREDAHLDPRSPSPMTSVLHRSIAHSYPVAARGQGLHIWDDTGKQYIDASGGAAVSCLGHGHPDVLAAMHKQLDTLAYAHTSFFTTRVAEEL